MPKLNMHKYALYVFRKFSIRSGPLEASNNLEAFKSLPEGSNVVPFWVSYTRFLYTTPNRYYIGAFG